MHGAGYNHLFCVAEYLAPRGADMKVWNRKNELGWTPVQIAAGVHRRGTIREQDVLASAVAR
jgi:hypothetical protein